MNILIRIPNWLGDAIMCSAAIEMIKEQCKDAKIYIVGSPLSVELFRDDSSVKKIVIDDSKSYIFRAWRVFEIAKEIPRCDIGISFQNGFYSTLLLYFSGAKIRAAQSGVLKNFLLTHKSKREEIHQVERYANIVRVALNKELEIKNLKISFEKLAKKRRVGINPGATYGSAKRWYPDKFAKVIESIKDEYEVVLFGSKNEIDICSEIERSCGKEVLNLCGKTNIKELCQEISSLELFITNDSGPMHIAAAYNIPTVAIFGPTKSDETSQWRNRNIVVSKNLNCSPCMKRVCPIKTHECMTKIEPSDVLKAISKLHCDTLK